MSNYIEYKDSIAFHPGYYIQEIVEDSALTQADFARRLDTTPKNLSKLIHGEQSLSTEMASKLSKMLGTSMYYWLNLQNAYDVALAQIASDEELEQEKDVLKLVGYGYFRDHFGLPDLPRKLDKQVVQLRTFLGVASLTVLTNPDLAASFRSSACDLDEKAIVKANAMVQIATNRAIEANAPDFDKKRFEEAVEFALTKTRDHDAFYPLVRERFFEAGVVFEVMPNLPGSKTNGATKRVGKSVMIMVNDRRLYADSFWFTLMHEVGHVMNGDFGISIEGDTGESESAADEYAQSKLIDPASYKVFVKENENRFTLDSITEFADSIGRDPGIVLGRLENDGYVGHRNPFQSLRAKYHVKVV